LSRIAGLTDNPSVDFPLPTKSLIPAPASRTRDDDLLREIYVQLQREQSEAVAARFRFVTLFGAIMSALSAVAVLPAFVEPRFGSFAVDAYMVCLMAACWILILAALKMERALRIRAKQGEFVLRLKGRQARLISIYPEPLFPKTKPDWIDSLQIGKLFMTYFALHFVFLLYLLLTSLGNSFFPDLSYAPFAGIAAFLLFVLIARKLWTIDEGRGLEQLDQIPLPAGLTEGERTKQEPPPPVAPSDPDWGDVLAGHGSQETVDAASTRA
jgi:hypothetical protein